MNRRFGDHTLPETHRRELQQIRKAAGDSFQEYSTRIEAKMSKAYSGMQNTEIYKSLSIEHMLNGIYDQSLNCLRCPYRTSTYLTGGCQSAVLAFFMQKWNQGQTAHPTNSSGKGTKYFRNQKSRKYGEKVRHRGQFSEIWTGVNGFNHRIELAFKGSGRIFYEQRSFE